MMNYRSNFNRLTCDVEETGEHIVLFDGVKYQGFDWLRKVCGNQYDNINDDLMNGPSPKTWLDDDPMNPILIVYSSYFDKDYTLHFHYET